jgi:hypothetical protein
MERKPWMMRSTCYWKEKTDITPEDRWKAVNFLDHFKAQTFAVGLSNVPDYGFGKTIKTVGHLYC